MWILLLAFCVGVSQADVGLQLRQNELSEFEQEILNHLRNYVDIHHNHVESIMPSVPVASFTVHHMVPYGRSPKSYQAPVTPQISNQNLYQPPQIATSRRDFSQQQTDSVEAPVAHNIQPTPYKSQEGYFKPETEPLRHHFSRQSLQNSPPVPLSQSVAKHNAFTPLQGTPLEPARSYGHPQPQNYLSPPPTAPENMEYSKNTQNTPVNKFTNQNYNLDPFESYNGPRDQAAGLPENTNNGYLPPHMHNQQPLFSETEPLNNQNNPLPEAGKKPEYKAQEQLSKASFIDADSGIDTKYAANGGYIY